MSERIEYQGDSLPSGLPGFGGGSVLTLSLPGFNRVVAAQRFGPAVDAPEVTPPDPTPPAGNTPDNPTDEVVTPPQPPSNQTGQDQRMTSLCSNYDCQSDSDLGQPLVYAKKVPDPICVACKKDSGSKYYPNFFTAKNTNTGIFYISQDKLSGKNSSFDSNWDLDAARLEATGSGPSFSYKWGIARDGITLTHEANEEHVYQPKELTVCVDGTTKNWLVLAYQKD
jgi:hypothetical protein